MMTSSDKYMQKREGDQLIIQGTNLVIQGIGMIIQEIGKKDHLSVDGDS